MATLRMLCSYLSLSFGGMAVVLVPAALLARRRRCSRWPRELVFATGVAVVAAVTRLIAWDRWPDFWVLATTAFVGGVLLGLRRVQRNEHGYQAEVALARRMQHR